jgi:hypothetical protein
MHPRFSIALALAALLSASLACNLPNSPLFAGDKTSYVDTISVSPSSAPKGSTLQLTINYFREQGDDHFVIACPTTPPGPDNSWVQLTPHFSGQASETLPLANYSPGKYTITCRSRDTDEASATFEITDPDAQKPENPASGGGFPKHKPDEISSAGLWMLFDQSTSNSKDRLTAPRQCLPGVNYSQSGGISALNIASDGSLSGSCSLTTFGGSQQMNGTLTGKWNAETGEVTFHLEAEIVYTNTIKRNGADITGQMTESTVFDGAGWVTSEYQATGTANWGSLCTSSNTEAIICSEGQKASLSSGGTVPWQLNFNPP